MTTKTNRKTTTPKAIPTPTPEAIQKYINGDAYPCDVRILNDIRWNYNDSRFMYSSSDKNGPPDKDYRVKMAQMAVGEIVSALHPTDIIVLCEIARTMNTHRPTPEMFARFQEDIEHANKQRQINAKKAKAGK